MTAEPLFPPPHPRRPKRDARLRAYALVVAIASQLEREGIEPRSRLVFGIALAAGAAPFRRASGLLWLGERRYGPRKLVPRTERERSRRLLIAVFKALERVDGKAFGNVSRARRAARAGASFDDHDVTAWLRRFTRPRADVRTLNLRQYQRDAQASSPGAGRVSFSISSIREIKNSALIATFEVSVTVGELDAAVTFEALLLQGPYGYFVTPAGIRDQAGAWHKRAWLSRSFAKAVCARLVKALGLADPELPLEPLQN